MSESIKESNQHLWRVFDGDDLVYTCEMQDNTIRQYLKTNLEVIPPKGFGDHIQDETLCYDDGKKKLTDVWNWLDEDFLLEMVSIMKQGAEKYEKDNWKKGTTFTRRLNSAQRHLAAFVRGEDNDEELGTSHLAACAVNCMFVYYWLTNNKGQDDRE